MNDLIMKLNSQSWADWSIERLEIDFETISTILSDSSRNNIVKIKFKDYIGFSYIGHWDESIIKDIEIEESGDLIFESQNIIKKLYSENPLPGGGTKKIDDKWYQANYKLIDGNTIKFVFKSVYLEDCSNLIRQNS